MTPEEKGERIIAGMTRMGQAFADYRITMLRDLIESPRELGVVTYPEPKRYRRPAVWPSVVEPFPPKVRRPSIIKRAWPYAWRIGWVILYAAGTWLLAASV